MALLMIMPVSVGMGRKPVFSDLIVRRPHEGRIGEVDWTGAATSQVPAGTTPGIFLGIYVSQTQFISALLNSIFDIDSFALQRGWQLIHQKIATRKVHIGTASPKPAATAQYLTTLQFSL